MVGGELCPKEITEFEEHKMFDEMSESKLGTFTTENDEYFVDQAELSGLGFIQMFEAIMEVNLVGTRLRDKWYLGFSRKPNMKRKQKGLSTTPRLNFYYYKALGGDMMDCKYGSLEINSRKQTEKDDVKKALFKCERISTELKWESYGIGLVDCDQYPKVELGSSREIIVAQNTVNEVWEAGH